jgi:5,10-methylenetetrahydrofolate reductase
MKIMNLQPYQQRVVEEHKALVQRINLLAAFMQTQLFRELDEAERTRMRAQREFMDGYSYMLQLRITAFIESDH